MDLPIWERKVAEGILRDVREELLWPSLLDTVACVCRDHWVNTFWLDHRITRAAENQCILQYLKFHIPNQGDMQKLIWQ